MDALLQIGLANALLATLLALFIAVLGTTWRRPALMHSLWLLVLLKLLMPPLVSVPIPWPVQTPSETVVRTIPYSLTNLAYRESDVVPVLEIDSEAVTSAPAEVAVVPAPDILETSPAQSMPSAAVVPWKDLLASLWIAGSLTWWIMVAWRAWRFQRLLRHAWPAPARLQEQARSLARQLGLGRCPVVWLVPLSVSPLVWALVGGPRLLLPAALWQRLTEEQQVTLLAHELAHLRRRDHWVRWLELLVLGLYWWHPVVWWARREIQEAEEECCDAWVVWALPQAAQVYAEALLETVAFLSQNRAALPVAASGIGHVQSLKRRLTMIMHATTPRALTWGGILAVLILGLLLLPLLPSWAVSRQAPAEADVAPEVAEAPAAEPPDTLQTDPARPPRADNTEPERAWKSKAELRNLPERLEEARDDIELLRVQVMAKEAEVQEANALLQKAKRQQERMQRLRKGNLADEASLDQAQTDVEVQESRMHVKQAQLQEARVRLRQGERRLAQLQDLHKSAPAPRVAPPAPEKPGRSALTTPPVDAPADIQNTPPPARSRPPRSSPNTPESSTRNEQRLKHLEDRLQALLTEMEALRKEMRSAQLRNPYVPTPQHGDITYPIPTPYNPQLVIPPQPRLEDPRSVPTVPLAPSKSDPRLNQPRPEPLVPDKNEKPR